jgi:hypothetical protein
MQNIRLLCVCVVVLGAADAAAQPSQPVGPFVVDIRGSLARFKEDPAVASALAVEPSNLPTRGLGVTVGAHWYPLRRGRLSIGIGGELVMARDSRTAEPDEDEEDTPTSTPLPTVTTRFSSLSPQLSLNFGKRDGWSYLSGGIGLAALTPEKAGTAMPDGDRVRAIHYGGGARWFTGPHVAFTFDVRFYTVSAQAAQGTRPSFPRSKFTVFSAGVSLR